MRVAALRKDNVASSMIYAEEDGGGGIRRPWLLHTHLLTSLALSRKRRPTSTTSLSSMSRRAVLNCCGPGGSASSRAVGAESTAGRRPVSCVSSPDAPPARAADGRPPGAQAAHGADWAFEPQTDGVTAIATVAGVGCGCQQPGGLAQPTPGPLVPPLTLNTATALR
jgi:hypothetical protein